ncbi:MAG: GGDEF domain-containing protein [Burkholderiaceae bacterium]
MPSLDPRSLIAMAGVMSLLMALVLWLMRRTYPKSIRGVELWAAAPLLWLLSTALFSLRGHIPDMLGLVVANTLLLLGSMCYHQGTRRFFGQPLAWRPWLLWLAATFAVMTVLTLVYPSYVLRVGFLTVSMSMVYGALLMFLMRHGGGSFPVRLVQTVLVLHLLVLVLRVYTLSLGLGGTDLMDRDPIQTVYIGAYVLTTLMLPIGGVLMATDRLRDELEHLATHDPLLPVLNRRAFMQAFKGELARARRSGKGPSLLMLDLDHFKAINDTHGHQHGDTVLLHVVERVQACLRSTDVLARHGGEEFAVLLPETPLADAQVLAQRLHTALTQGHTLDCTVSIGATAWQGMEDTVDAMLLRADAALYRAKDAGRNQTCVG